MVAAASSAQSCWYRSALVAAAPIQQRRACDALRTQVFDDGLDRREAGARGQQHDRLVAVFAQEEAAERAFQAQDVLFLHRAEDMVGELAAGHVAQVQFDRWRAAQVRRRVGH